jgi:hypothetical protein
MTRWTARDWISAILGWFAASGVAVFLPNNPWKLSLILLTGFSVTWLARLLIPRP